MFQNLFLSDWTQIDWDNSHKYITIQIHKKWNHSLKFWNAFFQFHKRSTKKINYFQKSAIRDLLGTFFHRFGMAVNAEPWEPENTLSRKLWRNRRLRVNQASSSESKLELCSSGQKFQNFSCLPNLLRYHYKYLVKKIIILVYYRVLTGIL